MQTWKTGVAALAAVATLLAGCGGSDDDDDADVSADVDTDLDEELEDAGVSEGCADALAAMSSASTGVSSAFAGDASDLEDAVEAMEDYADDAPEEIRDDFRLVASAYARFVEVIVESDIDLSGDEVPDQETMDALEDASAELDDEELSAASERIQEFFAEECKR